MNDQNFSSANEEDAAGVCEDEPSKQSEENTTLMCTETSAEAQGTQNTSVPEEQCQSIKNICKVDTLIIRCGHKDRNFKLSLPDGNPTNDGAYVLEVISSNHPKNADELTINLTGQCGNGHSSSSSSSTESSLNERPNNDGICPVASINGQNVNVSQPNPVKVKVFAPEPPDFSDDWKSFMKHILIPSECGFSTYNIVAQTCDGNSDLKAKIRAYTPASWNGEIKLGYSHGTHKDSNFNQNQGYKKLKVNGEWKLSGSIEVAIDNRKWKYGTEFGGDGYHKKTNAVTSKFFGGIQAVLNKVTPFFEQLKLDSSLVSIDVRWPNISLGGDVKNIELTDSWEVGAEGNIKLGLNPLIGATIKSDILNWLIYFYGGPLGKFLQKVKDKAAEEISETQVVGARAVIEVMLEVGGQIGSSIEWTKQTYKDWDAIGQVSGQVDFAIIAQVKLEGKIFKVIAGAGASISLKGTDKKPAAIKGTWTPIVDNEKPNISGQIESTGLAIYYALYAYIGVKSLATGGADKSKAKKRIPGRATSDESKLENTKEELLATICDPWVYPPERDKPLQLSES